LSKRTSSTVGNTLSPYYCSPEWHLARFGLATVLTYSLAYRLSKKYGKFTGSAERVGIYFGMNEKTIDRAFANLLEIGFFELHESGQAKFESSIYVVLSHTDWADTYPGQCREKEEFIWSKGDPLGRELYSLSDGRVKFKEYQIGSYRKLGFTDHEISCHWLNFLNENPLAENSKSWRKSASYHFNEYLNEMRDSMLEIPGVK
jgi:hypothetical protein